MFADSHNGDLSMTLKGSVEIVGWSALVSQSVTGGLFYVFLSCLNSFCIRIPFNLEFES